MKLLLVEDDLAIGGPLRSGLATRGHEVEWVTTGRAALDDESDRFVLLDLGLPDIDGVEVCKELRRRNAKRPIIVLTARGEEDDRVLGLDAGADDYVVKPFGFRELDARIRALERRSAGDSVATDSSTLTEGTLVVDRDAHRVTIDGADVALTPKEFDLLALLVENAGTVMNRQVVFDTVWNQHGYAPTKTLDVHLAVLRRKLGHPEWIETIRNVGIRFRQAG
ncbi:MAG: response regulator transcription factor [Actinobacteria bacterium]|nr:response regulator transcription factor [Actinomycetota bacterium]